VAKILGLGFCGYIGSRLHAHLSQRHTVDSVDLEWRGNPGQVPNKKGDYRRVQNVNDYDAVVLLAGHSSVAASRAQPMEAFQNNMAGLLGLACKMQGQPLIYASSASAYGIRAGKYTNMYDLTKDAGDQAVRLLYAHAYGLRFGTVCGASPNMRWDLMINKMVGDAMRLGRVSVVNGAARRPILGFADLCSAVDAVLGGNLMPGIYNVGSFNSTVERIAQEVAGLLGVPVEHSDVITTPAYDFEMPSSFRPTVTLGDIVTEVRKVVEIEWKEKVAV
jgi:nucleoside-diphosphate-sugar epimerase